MIRIVCIDTEYDARYTDLGVARLACLTYSFADSPAQIVGPVEAVRLWAEWVADESLTILGHSVHNDVAVLAQESHRRATGVDCVPGFGPHWELAHRLYESDRVVDTEIRQRLTHIRFGPHKAPVGLGELTGMLFGEDVSDTKSVPAEVRELLNDAVPYVEWPAELMARAPHRVLFGHYLETFGEDPAAWPADAVAYALEDVRLPWRVLEWQERRWGREIPDAKMQTQHAWMLHLVSIPGWLADRERAASIRERYRDVVRHCDRTLVDSGILHAPGRKVTAKRGRLQALIAEAFDGAPPLSKSLAKALTPDQVEALTPIERQDATGTDAKIVKQAIERKGPALTLADALGAEDPAGLCTATAAAALNAHVLYTGALARAKSAAKVGDQPVAVQCERVAEALLPVLADAGLVEVSHPRTIKKGRVADYIYAILGDETPLSKTAAETLHDPTPEQRHDNASTAAKTVRQAILHAEGHPLNVTDAVEQAEHDETSADADVSARFDAWLVKSGQPELNAYAVRSKADKTITNFLDQLDTPRRVRTNYVTCVDTGRTSCVAGWTLIKTRQGYRPIVDLKVGDYVWTHHQRWRRVSAVWRKGIQPMLALRLSNGELLTCTRAHRLLLSAGDWRSVGDILNDTFQGLGYGSSEPGTCADHVSGAALDEDHRHCGSSQYDGAQRVSCDATLLDGDRTQAASSAALCGAQAGREESDVRQDARQASALGRLVRDWPGLPVHPAQRQATTSASCRDGDSVGSGRAAGAPACSPYRWKQNEQRLGQPCVTDRSRPSSSASLAAPKQGIVDIVSAHECSSYEVYDISVEDDESYEACGVFNHNSRNVNVQQLPRDYDKPRHLHVRGCILPDPGWAFIVADYSQLELCALAHVLTQLVRYYAANPKRKAYAERILRFEIDEQYESSLSRAINNDQDCHVLMASVLRGYGETYEQTLELYERADKKKAAKEPLTADERQIIDDRQLSKPINFGYPGGLGARKFIDYAAAYGVSITLATANRTKVAYALAWPEMRLYFDHVGRLTADGDAVITQFYSQRERGGCYFTKACNGFFQALAADGAKYAGQLLVKHAYRVPTSPMFGTRPSGFVHDEYLVNSPRDQAELALPEVERLMIEGMRRYIPDVKIKAPGKVLYERWGK